MTLKLRRIWNRLFKYDWKFGIFLIILFGIPRFFIVLAANISGSYQYVSFIFMTMWFMPYIFLNKNGRKEIGIRKPANSLWLLYAFVAGILFCGFMYMVATVLYDHSINNCFVYISHTYLIPNKDFATFTIFALIAISFSPLGEELLYRGVIHGSFAEQFGETKASRFDSLAFALTHLAHFGIVYHLGKWDFLLVPAILWITGMYLVSRLFSVCRQKSGSILGAILCHAGFNMAMMYFIFYHIL